MRRLSRQGPPADLYDTISDMTDPTAVAAEREDHVETGEARVSYVIARLERAVRAAINERVRPYGLTTLQYTTLSVLGRRGGLSNAQLARRSYMTPQSMSEVIEALETKGLIKRDQHPNHRRVFPATLTATGLKVLEACDETVEAMEEDMLSDLSPAEREAFYHGLIVAVRGLHAGLPES
jgi:DNA-binding MarR family transcriptional regulator